MAADCVRIERMLYFGRDFLCGLDPPVLKLKFTGPSLSEYVSVVDGNGAASAQQRLRSANLAVSFDFSSHFVNCPCCWPASESAMLADCGRSRSIFYMAGLRPVLSV